MYRFKINPDWSSFINSGKTVLILLAIGDVGFHVLGCRVDILGTNCNRLLAMQEGSLLAMQEDPIL